jgi:hypothetical protein
VDVGGRPRTSGRKGRLDGNFPPKSSFMTSLPRRAHPPHQACTPPPQVCAPLHQACAPLLLGVRPPQAPPFSSIRASVSFICAPISSVRASISSVCAPISSVRASISSVCAPISSVHAPLSGRTRSYGSFSRPP